MLLLAALLIGGAVFAQSYDYDRIPDDPPGAPRPWATVALDAQEVSLPSGTPYLRFTLTDNKNPVEIGDMTIQFKHHDDDPTKLTIIPILKDGADIEFWANNPVQFFVESDGREIIVSVAGNIHEYTTFCMIKMVWKDPQGEVHKKQVAMAY